MIADGPEPGSWRGVAGMVEAWTDVLSVWEYALPKAEEYRELDDERVLVVVRQRGRGKTSGLELEQMRAKGAHLFHLQEGKVTRLVNYLNYERALADLGLAPEASSPGS